MRLLLEDGFSVEKGTGVGRYTQNLARELGKYPNVQILPPPASRLVRKIRPSSARRIAYAAWLETVFQTQIENLGADVVHFTNYLVPRNRRSKARYAASIHDLTAWKLPQALPPMYARYIRKAISRAVDIADLILCPSVSIRNEVIEHFNLSGERVRAAWNGHSELPEIPAERREELRGQLGNRLGLQKPYVLFVGTLERRKNVTTLVEAFARVACELDVQCVMVGKAGYGFQEIRRSIERQRCRDRYILAGFVTDEELALLYAQAELFAFPSLYEGFGTPLVEAMCFGLPIVASRIPSTEEVAAEAAVYYDDPPDHEALAGKMLEVLSNPELKRALGLRGKQRSGRFSWEGLARTHIEAYQSCLNGR
ncbi:MAG TPA: glycosyltransferase family 1 protein [Terriglobia bacterium]|nr:glycosyltransferase family 1 protein [Terriglobia bacterium]